MTADRPYSPAAHHGRGRRRAASASPAPSSTRTSVYALLAVLGLAARPALRVA